MDFVVLVTKNTDEIIYRLDPSVKNRIQKKLPINAATKIHISQETEIDYQYYHGDFEENQIPQLLTGMSKEDIKRKFDYTNMKFIDTTNRESWSYKL